MCNKLSSFYTIYIISHSFSDDNLVTFICNDVCISVKTCVAGVTGLEPATSCVTGRRSNQLSYTPTNLLVGGKGLEPMTLSV